MQDERCKALVQAIHSLPAPADGRRLRIMEVCGTHTMSIAKNGLKSLLPPHVELLSGPGCPVCVSGAGDIDLCLALARRGDVILCSYGDMLRVPGTEAGSSLLAEKARGADLRVLFSPMDALDVARENPHKSVVFLGVGFETSAPGTAAAVRAVKEAGCGNFFLLSLLKRVAPALEALAGAPDFAVDAFLCPGHVASVTGSGYFAFVPAKLGRPAAVAGFTAADILLGIYRLLLQLAKGEARLENLYPRAVREAGNPLAMAAVEAVFAPGPALWRGLGRIGESGLFLREPYADMDALKRFSLSRPQEEADTACRCGAVLRGAARPSDCPFFAKGCTPASPLGPCMVSGEGSCAAAYQYSEV